jgi:hypothetical protein
MGWPYGRSGANTVSWPWCVTVAFGIGCLFFTASARFAAQWLEASQAQRFLKYCCDDAGEVTVVIIGSASISIRRYRMRHFPTFTGTP